MDLITQGIIGATAAQSFSKKETVRLATFAGFIAGLLPDADAFIRSKVDTLLAIEYHRHFTHSLAFIPIGSLIAALIVWLVIRRRSSFKTVYLYCILGYATHGLLDACTSYGTRLLLPFSSVRVAWDNIAIIDPFYTLPLIVGVFWTLKTRKVKIIRTFFVISILYLLLGVLQRDRAIEVAKQIAASKNHFANQIQAKPTIGQLVLWKTIYTANGHYHVNAVRLGFSPFFKTVVYEGDSAPVLNVDEHYQGLDKNSVLYRDILRFQDFSSNMVILKPNEENVIGDARYSLLPHQISPLWGISVDLEKPDQHAVFSTFRNVEDRDWQTLKIMLLGQEKEGLPSFSYD
jgi:inner membrane protein